MGVVVQQLVPANTRILEFTGKRVDRETIDRFVSRGSPDSFLQVGQNDFIGASGRLDDYVNHSCDPNCGLEFEDDRVYLKSIKTITRGTELSYDYATSQSVFPLRFQCCCESRECRGEIGDFAELPVRKRKYYLSLNIVAPYLVHTHAVAGRKRGVKSPILNKQRRAGTVEREGF